MSTVSEMVLINSVESVRTICLLLGGTGGSILFGLGLPCIGGGIGGEPGGMGILPKGGGLTGVGVNLSRLGLGNPSAPLDDIRPSLSSSI